MTDRTARDPISLPVPAAVDFDALSGRRLQEMMTAGADVVECHRVLANTGGNIVGELLRGVETFFEWDHYPPGDVYDGNSHAQFYYHAHPQGVRTKEHGHFHTFMRPRGMPENMRPAEVSDFEMPEDPNDALCHLIGISMDAFGVPVRLFTTNRWVTGEIWYRAADVRAMLPRFGIDHAQPSWPVNRWITGMVRLFAPQIESLVDARDAAVEAWQTARPERNAFEDRELEVTSMLDIDIDDQIARVSAALAARG